MSRFITCISVVFSVSTLLSAQPFNDLTNYKSGISLGLSGANGTDWAIEQTYHDPHIGDQIIYIKSSTVLSLAHNVNNTFVNTNSPVHVIGINGIDSIPDSGDEGDIHFKIDRDQQAHPYTGASMPAWAPLYAGPFSLDTMMHDDSTAVMGTIGHNNEDWGSEPSNCPRGYFGINDAFGNEWHSLTYWDDDVTALQAHSITVHRQGASDGHYIPLCVNPVTPVIQLKATGDAQFYTTPAKTYHIPRIWQQTSYITAGVRIHFINLTNSDDVYYAIDRGPFIRYDGTPLLSESLFGSAGTGYTLSVRNGTEGHILTRWVEYEPGYPAPQEQHGNLLWANETELNTIKDKLKNTDPFISSYNTFKGSYYQSPTTTYDDIRPAWRATAGMAAKSLQNAFLAVIEGPSNESAIAAMAKTRLIRLARVQPVGTEADVNAHSPAKDYMNELSQTMGDFTSAAFAYDMLASCFRQSDHADGITPVEEYWIRDGLAEITTGIIGRMRANYSASIGGGDTHWSHGYEKVIGTMALAMPTYSTPYYGTSGGDFVSTNDHIGSDGNYWNPYKNNNTTWYDIATNPLQATDGHPDARYPVRSDFLMCASGYWTGPNDMQGDGDRYETGPRGQTLVDINSGGLANANIRVELVEMSGYESPFVTWTYAFELARRIKGDPGRIASEQTYIRRRLIDGYRPLAWNADSLTYTEQERRYHTGLVGFNNHFEYAGLPSAKAGVDTFLNRLNIYYGKTPGTLPADIRTRLDGERKIFYSAYQLAACARVEDVTDVSPGSLTPLPPIVKPLMKHVVQPGEPIRRPVICMDPCDLPLTVSVTDLPAGAVYDSAARIIRWDPQTGDLGVHIATVTASNGIYTTSRPCPLIVKTDLMAAVPAGPQNLTATMAAGDTAVQLAWEAPSGGTGDIVAYFLYRDGEFFATAAPGDLSYTDHEFLAENSHIRYHISAVYTNGSESWAANADPGYITTPARPSGIFDRTHPPVFGRITVSPSPFSQSVTITLPGTALHAIAAIHTQDGTMVKPLVRQGSSLNWDGTDSNGQTMPDGIYYCRLTDGTHSQQIRLVKVK